MQTTRAGWLLEGPTGAIEWATPTRTLAVQGCDEIAWADEEAFPPSVFGFLGPVYHHTKATLHTITSSPRKPQNYRFLLLEFQSCSQLLPVLPSLISLFEAQNFEGIALVSHTSCAPHGPCILPRILQALSFSPSFVSLVIWGTHLNQLLRLTFTVTYACSHIETYGTQHPPLHDLTLFHALTALHYKVYPQSCHLQSLPICDYTLHSLYLISLNFTDCELLPDAIHAWLTSNVQKALNLQSLVLSNNGIDDTGALKIISALRLSENDKLRILDLSHNSIKSAGVTCLASALRTNTALCHLYLGGNSTHLQPWTRLIRAVCTINRTLEKLQVDGPAGQASIQVLCDLIKTNARLEHLEIWASKFYSHSDIVAIFKSLQKNKSLTSFALPSCKAIDGVDVYETILETLMINDRLETLDLSGAPIMQNPKHSSTITSFMHRFDDEEQLSPLRHLSKVQPTTSRVFLCGDGLAGKTTLCKTMTKVLKSWHERYFRGASDLLTTALFGQSRTKGIEITHIECNEISISLWDLAGQREYHSFHDLMFPHEIGPALFIVVCNLMTNSGQNLKSRIEIKIELEYWLSYISSNTAKLKHRIPNVILVFSHKDKLPTSNHIVEWVNELASQLRQDYGDFTKVVDDMFIINCRNKEDAKDVAQFVLNICGKLLTECPPIYDLCNKARCWINTWNYEHPEEPWLQTSEFCSLAKHELTEFMRTSSEPVSRHTVKELITAVCHHLHDSGHVIFFKEISLVFLNPGWFTEKVMGGIIDRAMKSLDSVQHLREGDVWNRKGVEKMLEEIWKSGKGGSSGPQKGLSISALINILLKLDFCYELDPGNPNSSLFIPSTLQYSSHSGSLQWDSKMQGACIYLGRRLKCANEKQTFLTPGFFPALQVRLRKDFSFPALYSVKRNLIRIHVDRIEVLIEFCEAPITFIDILVRSGKNSSQTIEFVRENLVEKVQRLQSVTGHWQGIDLVEGIIRPACVEHLTPCTRRLDQFVLVDDLRKILLNSATDTEDVTFPWPASPDLNLGVEQLSIKELLGEEEVSHILGKALTQITHVSEELHLSLSPIKSTYQAPNRIWKLSLSDLNSNTTQKHIYSLTEEVRSMMHDIKVDVKDLKRAVEDLVKQGQMLVPQLHKWLTELLINNRESKLPRLFVLMKGKKLVTNFIPGLTNVNLQFMCEHEGGLHVPLNQLGYDMSIIDNDTLARVLPYLKNLLSIIVLGLKVGAHIVGGVSELVPDLSSSMDDLIQASGLAVDALTSSMHPDEVLNSSTLGEPLSADRGDKNSKFLIASAWVEEFLENKGCVKPFQVFKMFGLVKTKLTNGRILWLCEKHIDDSCNQVDWHS